MILFLLGAALAADPTIPDQIWTDVVAGLGVPADAVGYSAAEMAHYGGDAFILPSVVDLFSDVRKTARFSARTTDVLVDAADRPDELLRQLFILLGSSTGRGVPLPGLDPGGMSGESPPAERGTTAGQPPTWGVPELPDGTPAADALALLVEPAERKERKARAEALARFAALPEPVQRLVVRLTVASLQVGPWVNLAVADTPGQGLPAEDVYRMLSAIRTETDFPDSGATRQKNAFTALERTDLGYLGFASIVWAKHARLSLDEYRAAGGDRLLSAEACRGFGEIVLPTRGGPIVITDGDGRSRAATEAPMLVVDLGGDDGWTGRYGVSTPWPVSVLVDLGGNDTYQPSGDEPVTLATGLLGVGAVVDLDGDDTYRANESSLASAWHGTGLLLDASGDDTYTLSGAYGSAAAHAGVALLVDGAGNDHHVAKGSSQAMGGPRGAALLLDVAGDDTYTVPDDADPSALYLGRTVAMSQGCGYGRRADFGDGHSLAGGFGFLVDVAGNDRYHAMAWSQGAAYWWGVGVLDDRAGDDTYRNGKYSLGAGAHYGIGIQTDHAGNDQYNTGIERFVNPFTGEENWVAENQFQGHARDGSLGLSFDLGGDDAYLLRSHSGGSGDLGAIGLFYEAGGNDTYRLLVPPPTDANAAWAETPPLGSTTHYPDPFRTWRDDLFTFGIFVDAGGNDTYTPVEGVEIPERSNDDTWTARRSDHERAVGIDR